jgi:hypothetical protein
MTVRNNQELAVCGASWLRSSMTSRTLALSALVGLIFWWTPASAWAQSPGCTEKLADVARLELSKFVVPKIRKAATDDGLWARFETLVMKYKACDDGSLAESFSGLTIEMLDRRWLAAMNFRPLHENAVLRQFVARHIDTTLRDDDIRRVLHRATKECRDSDGQFCTWIAVLCDRALREQQSSVDESKDAGN